MVMHVRQITRACCYGKLAFCPIRELNLAESRKCVEIAFDEALVCRALAAVAGAHAAADQPIPPPLLDIPKCPRCSFVGKCLPDETAVLQERD
jgi:CRISP-associated protein Cas1